MKTTEKPTTVKTGALARTLKSIPFLGIAYFLYTTLPSAHARDMQGRLGLGYNSQFSAAKGAPGIPAVSFKYGVARDIAFAGIVGIDTSSPSTTLAAAKFFKNIFFENNLNFYFMGGAGYVSANSKSGIEVQTGFGTEFFIPGLESLGFSVETGASFDNLGDGFAFRTMGVSFLSAGIHFYF